MLWGNYGPQLISQHIWMIFLMGLFDSLRVLHISSKWWLFTGVWVTASLLRFLETSLLNMITNCGCGPGSLDSSSDLQFTLSFFPCFGGLFQDLHLWWVSPSPSYSNFFSSLARFRYFSKFSGFLYLLEEQKIHLFFSSC